MVVQNNSPRPDFQRQRDAFEEHIDQKSSELERSFSQLRERIAADKAARDAKSDAPLWVPALLLGVIGTALILLYRKVWRNRQVAATTAGKSESVEARGLSDRLFAAYRERRFDDCVSLSVQLLAKQAMRRGHHINVSAKLVTIVALRRAGRAEEGEALSVDLLRTDWGPGGEFLYLMRILDGDLSAERFLSQLGPDTPSSSPELECKSFFYEAQWHWAKGDLETSIRCLQRSLAVDCDAFERSCAACDLAEARQTRE